MSRYKNLKKVAEATGLRKIAEEVIMIWKGVEKSNKWIKKTASHIAALIIRSPLNPDSEKQFLAALENSQTLRRICGYKKVPDQSTFTKLRKRVSLGIFESIFSEFVAKVKGLGIAKGRLIVTDSTDITAWCNPNKKKLSDPDAAWGYSSTKGMVFGYKVHVMADVESELPLAVTVFPANIHDHDGFFPTWEKLFQHFSFQIQKLIGDSAYDATDIYQQVRPKRIVALIAVNGRGHYDSVTPKDKDYKIGRAAIERVNSRGKELLGLDNLKFRGLKSATIHALCSMIAMLFVAVGSFLTGAKSLLSIKHLRQ